MKLSQILGEWTREHAMEEAKARNFLTESYSPRTTNKCGLVSISENNAKRIIDKHSGDGYVIVSPCRGFAALGINPDEKGAKEKLAFENKKAIRKFTEILKQSPFSYTPAYGGFIENLGTPDEENVYERSFIVYNHRKDGSVGDFSELYKFATEMGNMFGQESVLIKAPKENPKYVDKEGNNVMDFSGDTTFNDLSQEYFTDLHKNTNKTKGGIENRKPTRFTYLETFINPAPQCYGEAIKRAAMGEVFITE